MALQSQLINVINSISGYLVSKFQEEEDRRDEVDQCTGERYCYSYHWLSARGLQSTTGHRARDSDSTSIHYCEIWKLKKTFMLNSGNPNYSPELMAGHF